MWVAKMTIGVGDTTSGLSKNVQETGEQTFGGKKQDGDNPLGL